MYLYTVYKETYAYVHVQYLSYSNEHHVQAAEPAQPGAEEEGVGGPQGDLRHQYPGARGHPGRERSQVTVSRLQ